MWKLFEQPGALQTSIMLKVVIKRLPKFLDTSRRKKALDYCDTVRSEHNLAIVYEDEGNTRKQRSFSGVQLLGQTSIFVQITPTILV
jgi:hypothetical protein